MGYPPVLQRQRVPPADRGLLAALDGSFGVFNAISPFGPVPGFGVVDPPAFGNEILITLSPPGGGQDLQEIVPIDGTQIGPVDFCSDPSQTIPGISTCLDPNGNPVGFAEIPEPPSAGLLGIGALALLWRRRRR
jgi:hypothetical protein